MACLQNLEEMHWLERTLNYNLYNTAIVRPMAQESRLQLVLLIIINLDVGRLIFFLRELEK